MSIPDNIQQTLVQPNRRENDRYKDNSFKFIIQDRDFDVSINREQFLLNRRKIMHDGLYKISYNFTRTDKNEYYPANSLIVGQEISVKPLFCINVLSFFKVNVSVAMFIC